MWWYNQKIPMSKFLHLGERTNIFQIRQITAQSKVRPCSLESQRLI